WVFSSSRNASSFIFMIVFLLLSAQKKRTRPGAGGNALVGLNSLVALVFFEDPILEAGHRNRNAADLPPGRYPVVPDLPRRDISTLERIMCPPFIGIAVLIDNVSFDGDVIRVPNQLVEPCVRAGRNSLLL